MESECTFWPKGKVNLIGSENADARSGAEWHTLDLVFGPNPRLNGNGPQEKLTHKRDIYGTPAAFTT